MKKRGVSLVELIATLFILSLVIFVAADLMVRARQVSNFYSQKSALQGAASALQQLSGQLVGACNVTSPTMNGNSPTLQFVRVKPDLPTRLPTTLGPIPSPEPPPSPAWDPCASAWQETISVSLRADGWLVWTSTDGSEKALAGKLTRFDCHSQGRLLEMTAEVSIRGQLQSIKVSQNIEEGVDW